MPISTLIPPKDSQPVVLYVSDDTAYLNTVRRSLGQAGFTAMTTPSPLEALELSRRSVIDAVLCDYDMLQMDAVALIEHLAVLHGKNAPPTLVIGDQHSPALLIRCTEAGAVGLHAKSDSIEILLDRVTSMIRDEGKSQMIQESSARRRFEGGTDPHTGIASRDHFARRFNGESLVAYRDQYHLSLVMVVIDRFDTLSERYGRHRADSVLAQTARLIEGELRTRDCAARYEEHIFAVILPETPLDAASAVGRRLKERLASTEFGDLDQSVLLTVSIGAACRPPGTTASVDDLIAQALLSCEAAQKMGGDRVVSDTTLTGRPLILVACPSEEMRAVADGLGECNVEVRTIPSCDGARDLLQTIPVAMVVVPGTGKDVESAMALLNWTRSKFPSVKRVLASNTANIDLMKKAINQAAVSYFISLPVDTEILPAIVENLLFP